QSAHVPGRRVAKGVLIRVADCYVLAVLPATTRIDLARLAEVLGSGPVRLATEEEIGRVFADCERGALPPVGRAYGLPTGVDAGRADGGEIFCVGNQRHEGLRLRFADYAAMEAPVVAGFAVNEGPARASLRLRAG